MPDRFQLSRHVSDMTKAKTHCNILPRIIQGLILQNKNHSVEQKLIIYNIPATCVPTQRLGACKDVISFEAIARTLQPMLDKAPTVFSDYFDRYLVHSLRENRLLLVRPG